jgi:DNA modification methylase
MAKKKPISAQPSFESFSSLPLMPEGYYSGDGPNSNLRSFATTNFSPYDAKSEKYRVAAFRNPVTVANRRDPINDLHIYWSKKPYTAIQQYIHHYTQPGDLVLDPFCGSGGTLLAALLDGRKAIGIDASPAATFISKNYCTPIDLQLLDKAYRSLASLVQKELDWLYETRCDRCSGQAAVTYMVHSQVFQCPRCLVKVPLFDCLEVESETAAGKPKKVNVCPQCYLKGHVEVIRSQSQKFGFVPVMTSYICKSGCSLARGDRTHNDSNERRRQFFEKYDSRKLKEIDSVQNPHWYPKGFSMKGFSRYRRDALFYYGVEEVADLFSSRSRWALSAILAAIKKLDMSVQNFLLFAFSGTLWNASRMYRHRELGGGPASGMYYMPQVYREVATWTLFSQKVSNLRRAAKYWTRKDYGGTLPVLLSTQSSCDLSAIPSNSIDYIFTDPPYAEKVQYGELNYVWEAWLGLNTGWHKSEVIVNDLRGRSEGDWSAMMTKAMAECFRVLKPRRWLSLCYHDTSEGTWELVQDILAQVGFVVDRTDSTLFIDTGQKTYNQLTADKATKRDLVLNFYKPKPSDLRVTIYIPDDEQSPTFLEAAKQVVRDYLTVHPGATKDRIYDAVVSCMVSKGQMEAHDFDALLRSVAEEVQQPVKEALFHDKEPDLWASHIQSRWYLKETADQIDQAEQVKEDAAAARLDKFIGDYLREKPELEGVHYSDLFEQYLPAPDKPRRLLADWLPEYFIKTPSGTWRLPDKEEGEQLAKLRKAGTLRRVKRFANALIEGVPVRDKDRPQSDVDLLDWLRQCRRAGLYEQGRAIYEKGGLNLADLDDEQQIEAEDDYRICVRRGASEEAKPKRQRRKKQYQFDDE